VTPNCDHEPIWADIVWQLVATLAIQMWALCPLCQTARARFDGGHLVHDTAAEKSAKLSEARVRGGLCERQAIAGSLGSFCGT